MFADEMRIDTWVVRVGLAVPVLCILVIFVWHAIAFLGRRLDRPRRALRESPEPAANARGVDPLNLDATTLRDELAEAYLQLADCRRRLGQPEQAAATLQKVLRHCPDSPHAAEAKAQLGQLDAEIGQFKASDDR